MPTRFFYAHSFFQQAAEARKRQGESLERLHQAALLSARFQLDASELNRARLQTFLALISEPQTSEDEQSV